jgi:molecular chaperone GrpE
MARGNGRSKAEELDVEHELPASDASEPVNMPAAQEGGGAVVEARDTDVEKLRAERDLLLDRLARLQAEFENARKRTAREQQEFREYALSEAMRAVLPVVDSFERALQSGAGEKSEFRGGVELIYRQLLDALAKLGLRPITAKGELFDPRWHEAIEAVDTSGVRDHEVVEELQRGYKLKDRMLRPAMVKVARNPQ